MRRKETEGQETEQGHLLLPHRKLKREITHVKWREWMNKKRETDARAERRSEAAQTTSAASFCTSHPKSVWRTGKFFDLVINVESARREVYVTRRTTTNHPALRTLSNVSVINGCCATLQEMSVRSKWCHCIAIRASIPVTREANVHIFNVV